MNLWCGTRGWLLEIYIWFGWTSWGKCIRVVLLKCFFSKPTAKVRPKPCTTLVGWSNILIRDRVLVCKCVFWVGIVYLYVHAYAFQHLVSSNQWVGPFPATWLCLQALRKKCASIMNGTHFSNTTIHTLVIPRYQINDTLNHFVGSWKKHFSTIQSQFANSF